jgi:two-component sensor histidine kinase
MAKRGDKLLWGVIVASAALALATVIATWANPPTPPPFSPGGRSLPRMRGPVGDVPMGDMLRSIGVGSLTWYVSILSAPLFIWLSRRVPFDRRRWVTSLAVHLTAVLALVVLTGIVQYNLTYAGNPGAPTAARFIQITLLTGALPFLTVAATAHALDSWVQARDRELDAERARSELAEARLAALSAQLQPHFLFNTLQAISTLISRDPGSAEKMLAHLADLLREVLRHGDKREIPLQEELRVLEAYLEISRRRFGDRLGIELDIDPKSLQRPVPFFVLQPLVENALHHGVGARSGPASVRISATENGDRLLLSVVDDGPGMNGEPRQGIGLANTEARLSQLYGSAARMTTDSPPGGGFSVQLSLPLR